MNNTQKQGSIKFKLLAIIIPVVTVILFILTGIAYYQSNRIITRNANEILSASTKKQVNEIEAWMNQNLEAFQTVKTSIENSTYEKEELQQLLDTYYQYNSNYPDGFYIANQSTLLKASESNAHQGEDIKNAVWFIEGMSRINMRYGSAYVNQEGKNVISASGMLLNSTDSISVISADVSLDRISIIVNSLVEMNKAEAILVDKEDLTILAARDPSLIFTTLGNTSPLYQTIAEKLVNRDYEAGQMNKNMVNFQKVTGTNWILVSYVPTSFVFADLSSLRTFMILIGLISIVVLILIIERVTHVVLHPIKSITNTIVTMGHGDFTVDVKIKGNDEISLMSHSMKDFIIVMRRMIQDINEISKKLYAQSQGSSQIASHMSGSSTLQSDSMKNLNLTVDELAKSINIIAESANSLAHFVYEASEEGNQVNEKINETVSVSEKGRNDMEQVLIAMGTIQTSIKTLEEAINKVGDASSEITEIVNLIGNIAEETSLLSLNASIEAARAGASGKGFAVVASEIGKLSSTSTQAVLGIEKLINEIVAQVNNAVKQAKESAEFINDSSVQVTNAGKTFEIIFDDIVHTNDMIQHMLEKIAQVDQVASNVAAISQEQAASSEEILATSEEMVHQANSIADSSKQVAEESEELKETSDRLSQQVALFKL